MRRVSFKVMLGITALICTPIVSGTEIVSGSPGRSGLQDRPGGSESQSGLSLAIPDEYLGAGAKRLEFGLKKGTDTILLQRFDFQFSGRKAPRYVTLALENPNLYLEIQNVQASIPTAEFQIAINGREFFRGSAAELLRLFANPPERDGEFASQRHVAAQDLQRVAPQDLQHVAPQGSQPTKGGHPEPLAVRTPCENSCFDQFLRHKGGCGPVEDTPEWIACWTTAQENYNQCVCECNAPTETTEEPRGEEAWVDPVLDQWCSGAPSNLCPWPLSNIAYQWRYRVLRDFWSVTRDGCTGTVIEEHFLEARQVRWGLGPAFLGIGCCN